MDNVKRLTIFGASPSSESKLKCLVKNTLQQNIQWVKSTHESAEGIIINSKFLSSEQVQKKYIGEKKINVVCYYRSANKDECLTLAKCQNIIALNIDNPTTPELTVWLNALINSHDVVCASKNSPLFVQEEKKTTSNNNRSQPENNILNTKNSTDGLSKNYTDLLSYIKSGTGSCVIYYDKENNIALFDLNKKEIYLNFNAKNITGIDNCSWKKTKEIKIPENNVRLNLETWLFESIWQSNIDCRDKIEKTFRFKIKYWPQPINPKNRSKVLFLAACVQKSNLDAQQLQQKTGFDYTVVCRFLYASLQAGVICIVDQDVQQANVFRNTQIKKDVVKTGLLNKLRNKLGIG